MAVVYVLYSESIDSYYTGSCLSILERLEQHKTNKFGRGFTSRAEDWEIYFLIEGLSYQQARLIERHIKQMESRKYIENLKKYPEISGRLKAKFS